jgi:hypothetical protein
MTAERWTAGWRGRIHVALALALTLFLVWLILPWSDRPPRPAADGIAGWREAESVVVVAGDNAAKVYVDGRAAGATDQWMKPVVVGVPQKERVLVAVEATNQGGQGGLLGMRLTGSSSGDSTPADWRCSEQAGPGWLLPDFDDSAWEPAMFVAAYGDAPWGTFSTADLSDAEWVWTTMPVPDQMTIYCRWWAAPPGPNRTERAATQRRRPFEDRPRALLTADNSMSVYVDGSSFGRQADWTTPLTIPMPESQERVLVAVEVTNNGGAGGLLGAALSAVAEDGEAVLAPADWRCHGESKAGWHLPEFDDESWTAPQVIAEYGSPPWSRLNGPDLDGSRWVWLENPVPELSTMFCRWWAMPPEPSPAPPRR